MTDRLRHSPAGYRRLIQITQAEVFVLVEGRLDRVFYDSVCALALDRRRIRHDIRMVGELPVSTGGKPGILEFYDSVRRRKELVSEFKGKKTVVVFFLDKDIDDIARTARRWSHVIYTEMFEVENYLFSHGDVTRALATVLRLPRQSVHAVLPPTWRVSAAEAWREWTILCVLVQLLRVSVEANYRVSSRINQPCTFPTDITEFERRLADIRVRSALPQRESDATLRRATSAVDRRYEEDRHDTVFRGKWYPHFLRHWTSAAADGGTFSDGELLSALLASMVYDAPWSAKLVQAIEDLVRRNSLIAA